MSNRKAGELNKFLSNLSQLGFNKEDEKVVRVINEIEKELELQTQVESSAIKDPNKALVIGIKDNSGSIGEWENKVFKEYYDLAKKEIEKHYDDLEEMFIVHHTEAKISTKYNFFNEGKAGGTIASSALRELKKHLNTDREVIVIQFSDGDNLTSDNYRTNKILKEDVLPKVKYFKYVEANQYNCHSTLMNSYKYNTNDNFKHIVIKLTDDALKGLRFGEELESLN